MNGMTPALQEPPPRETAAPPDIFVEPALGPEHVADVMHRLAWYAAPLLSRGATIHAALEVGIEPASALMTPDSLSEDAHAPLRAHLGQIRFSPRPKRPRGAIRIIWDGVHAARLGLVTNDRVIVADDRSDPHAADAWMRLALIDAPGLQARAAERLSRFAERIGRPRDALLVGPGRMDAQEARFDADLRIACNAVVEDDALWARAGPQILAFADPWAHAGPSRSAGAFRRRVFERMLESGLTIVTPERCAVVLEAAAPACVRELIIPVREAEDADLLGDTREGILRVRPTGNVLTALMMPLASWSGATDIKMVGFDAVRSRATGWRHARQQEALETHLATAQAHPATAPSPFSGYAARHRARARRLADALRRRGASVKLPEGYADPFDEEAELMNGLAAVVMRRERLISLGLLAAGAGFALAGAGLIAARYGVGPALAALSPAFLIGFLWLDTRRRVRIVSAELARRLARRQARRDALIEARLRERPDRSER